MIDELKQRSAYRGLAWLALGNIVFAALMMAAHVLLSMYAPSGTQFAYRVLSFAAPIAYFATIVGQVLPGQ